MQSRRFVLSALVLALLLPASALGWNATAHEVIAGIAWDNMTPSARAKAIALLQKAPRDACLGDLFPKDSRSLALRQREFFMKAATWPDLVRAGPGPCSRYSQAAWHFVDRFWQGVSGATGFDAPKDRPDIPTPSPNTVDRLTAFNQTVACDKCASESERATQLAWILHLVGDLHQPLHTSSRVTPAYPQGDMGGNRVRLTNDPRDRVLLTDDPHAPSLHAFWDRIIDDSVPVTRNEKSSTDIRYLDRVRAMIVHDHPPSRSLSILPGNFEAWSREGLATAKAVVYPQGLYQGELPINSYRQTAFATSDAAIAMAGYRLADLLNRLFDGH